MKYFFPLKFAVLYYSVLFLSPLFFILHLPNPSGIPALKIFLGLFMLFVFLDATRRHPEITLGAFMVYLGVLFIPMVLFWATVIGSVSGFLFFVQIFLKFKFINKTEGEGMFSPRYDEMIARRKKD